MPAKLDSSILKQPTDDQIAIWRYMDIAKFISMIHTGHLYFPRADTFLDKYEGSIPRGSKNILIDNQKHTPQEMLRRTYMSCWHENENESAAMWQLYTLSGQGLAIKSSYSKLAKLLPGTNSEKKDSAIYLGKVSYIDYQKEDVKIIENPLLPFTYKRIAFEHEKEIRAVFQLPKEVDDYDQVACPVKIDVNQLIEAVYLAPGSAFWFRDVVHSVKNAFKIDAPLHMSSLEILEPYYG